jgi:hypothetical protein
VVVVAWNDVYYALDGAGRGFTNAAMVEGVFRPSAPDGRALLAQAILWRALETHPASFVTREGLHGAAMAKERGIGALEEARGETERWWGDSPSSPSSPSSTEGCGSSSRSIAGTDTRSR